VARPRPSSPSPASLRRVKALRLYGRRGCHLCEELAAELGRRGIAFDEINVDADPVLKEKYGLRVPVLTDAEGHEIENPLE
jgi:hypothetical protein